MDEPPLLGAESDDQVTSICESVVEAPATGALIELGIV